MQFAGQAIDDWNRRLESEKARDDETTDGGDLLYTNQTGSLLSKIRRNPANFRIEDIFYHMSMNVLAGGETTAASTANIIYYLIKNPRVLNKLREDLETALRNRNEPSPRISMKEAQNVPYLQAVIKESLRILPNGLHLPRIVPQGGLTLAGQFFPEGVSLCIPSNGRIRKLTMTLTDICRSQSLGRSREPIDLWRGCGYLSPGEMAAG